MRKKRSPVYKLPSNDFKKLLNESRTYSDVCRSFNISNRGGNIATIKRRIKEEGLQSFVDHFEKGCKDAKRRKPANLESAKEMYFTKNNNTGGATLRNYVRRYKMLKEECSCGLTDCWQNAKLILQLDHINGDRTDNRLENLRWLCPNCHSQTHSFAGRKKHCRMV